MRAIERHSTLLATSGVLAAGSIWGLFWYPLRYVEGQGVSSDWVNLLFFAVSTATILPFAANRGGFVSDRGQLLTGLLLGAAFAFYTLSLVMTEVVRAILLFYLTPVWSTLIGTVVQRERLTVRRIVALTLGFAGLWLIIRNEHGLPIPRNAGDWIGLFAGFCWSVGTMRSYHRPAASIASAVLAFSLGGFAITVAAMAFHFLAGELTTDFAALGRVAPLILSLGFCMFSIPNLVVLWAAQRVEPARVGILLLAEVLTGTVSAAIYSGEPFEGVQALGALLIVTAAVAEVTARS